MKTVKKNKEIERVSDSVAAHRIKNEGWKYCSKTEWREKVRDAKPKNVRKKKAKKKALTKN